MALRDILKISMNYAGIPISDREFINGYNDALHDFAMLYNTAKARKEQVIVCEDPKAEYDLSPGCLKIEQVKTSHGNAFSLYSVLGRSKITFAIKDTYTLAELFDQSPVIAMADEVTIDGEYIKAVAEYVASKAVRKTDKDLSKELLDRSYTDATAANTNIRKATNPNKKVRAPIFR
jgi:hypothetical protein